MKKEEGIQIAIRVGLVMGIVTISPTIKTTITMVEIAVDLMLILNIAIYVNALKKEGEEVEELQHLLELQLAEAAIKVRLLMGIVMILTTILNAPTMVEIAVDLMSTLNTALYVNASIAMVTIIIKIFE